MSSGKSFSIYLKTLTGANSETRVTSSQTVFAVKQQIQAQLGFPVLRLLYKNKELDESKTLADAGVAEESIIIVITETEKPCHFFFALDESGSMSGGRWNALIQSFVEFIDKRHASSAKNEIPIQDRVSVFFHETRCRLASWRKSDGTMVPFEDIPIAEVQSDSLVNNFKGGGNNFDHVLNFLFPYLKKCHGYTPVLMFMTDGGDCGDDDPRGGNFRQRAYDTMARIKGEIPDLRVYVTSVFTTCAVDIEGAKQLCRAAGMDPSTHYNHIEDDGSAVSHYSPPSSISPYSSISAVSPMAYHSPALLYPSAAPMPSAVAYGPPPSFPPQSFGSVAPSSESAAPSPMSYAAVPTSSAQRKMASHWDAVYSMNSPQAQI